MNLVTLLQQNHIANQIIHSTRYTQKKTAISSFAYTRIVSYGDEIDA